MSGQVESRTSGAEGRRASARRAFSLIELLVTLAVIAVLAGLLLPALNRSKTSAQRVQCVSGLRQLGLAAQMYWDDNGGHCFRYGGTATNGGQLYWFGWLGPGAEGQRAFDATQGALFAYLRGRGVEICPSLNYVLSQFKLKATGAAYGYGYDLCLSAPLGRPPVTLSEVRRPAATTLLADAAQVNTWQAPASPDRPMLEEWYYVDDSTNQPNGHFRHQHQAEILFCDGHVAPERPVPGSLDPRLPEQWIGRLRSDILLR